MDGVAQGVVLDPLRQVGAAVRAGVAAVAGARVELIGRTIVSGALQGSILGLWAGLLRAVELQGG